MPVVTLTDLFIKSIKPATRTIYWDETLPAFGIRVGARSKVFIVMHGADRAKTTLGRYGEHGISLKDARKRAGSIIYGSDALQDDKPASKPISDAIQAFARTYPGKERTIRDYERLLNRHLLTAHKSKTVADITTAHVIAITDGLKSTPSEQIHAHAAMSVFFKWALARKLTAQNPMADLVQPGKPGERDRVLTDEELAGVYHAANAIGYPFGSIVLLCIHLGLRRSEAANLRRVFITDSTITIPPELAKNNTKLVLPNTVQNVLERIPAANTDLLFPSGAGTPFSAWSKNKLALDARSGITGYCLHDLRRTFSTIHARIGTPPHVTEAILNHKTGTLTPIARIYNRHDYFPQALEALQNYERELQRLLAAHPCSAA